MGNKSKIHLFHYSTAVLFCIPVPAKVYAYVVNLLFLVVIVSFNESVYSVNENDKQVQPVLVLSQSSSTDISVLITVLDGSATGELASHGKALINLDFFIGGSDYNYSMHVTIPADVISVQFTISIINDDLMEGNEDFILFINPETLPLGVFSDYPDASLINIIDDDCKSLVITYLNTLQCVF